MVAEITAPISLKNVLGYNFAKVKAGNGFGYSCFAFKRGREGQNRLASCINRYGKPSAVGYSH